MNLTKQDVETLIDAVEAWEVSLTLQGALGDMVTSALCRDEEQRREVSRRMHDKVAQLETEKRSRKERSIVLRAKLLAMRDSLVAGQFVDQAIATESEDVTT